MTKGRGRERGRGKERESHVIIEGVRIELKHDKEMKRRRKT